MSKNAHSLLESKYSRTKSDKSRVLNIFDFINQIKTDDISSLILLEDLNISYSQIQSLSGFRLNSFANKELYFDFYQKINHIKSINITDTPYDSYYLLRIMILISLLSINEEGMSTHNLDLKLKKINNEEIKQEEIELANQIRNIDKSVDLINEGWIINSINYRHNNAQNEIESISLSKGSEKILISSKNSISQSTLSLHQLFPHSFKALAPSSPHSNQHSMNRQKRQSTRQFDRTDYSNESSNYYEDYDYYTDDDDELLKDTFLNEQNESGLFLSRRTNSEPFIEIDPMLIFTNSKKNNDSNENIHDSYQENENEDKKDENENQTEIDELDIIEIKPQIERKTKNDNSKNDKLNTINDYSKNNKKNNSKQNLKSNNDKENDTCSYSSNSSDFDYNYYSSGEEEITTTNSKKNKINVQNYSHERRRHQHRHHQISKQIKNKIELRKLEESPRRTTQLYIDEFDDVRKLYSSHNKQNENLQTNNNYSTHKKSKNNNKREFEDDLNDSDDSDENEVPSHHLIKPSFSSPPSVGLTLPYELIDFTDNKNNYNEINDQELDDEDDTQPTLQINLNVKLNFGSKKKKIQSFEEEEDDDDDLNSKINNNRNKNNSINDLVEINDFIYDDDNENSSSDSNEDFDDLVYIQKNKNIKSNSNDNFIFESNDVENDENLPMINDDIFCSEPFPTGNGNQNDNALVSPNHRKPTRSSKKRLINNS